MPILKQLQDRANGKCELTQETTELVLYPVPPADDSTDIDQCIAVSQACYDQLTGSADIDPNAWRGLSESMWSTVPAVQVVAYRMLNALQAESWAQNCLDMIYLEDDVKTWAEAAMPADADSDEVTRDSNGTVLQAGDNVTIIKDLQVKGAGFTAKRGTAVRGISLTSNPEHIEGRVNGQRIVLVAKFLKKM